MLRIKDYKNPFDAIFDFESALAQYVGAPYCVTTDSCTHAIEIALRLTHNTSQIIMPAHTYLSVPMTLHKLNIPIQYMPHIDWWEFLGYHLMGSNVYDYARRWQPGMYRSSEIQCVSFGTTKPVEIGTGGALFTDSKELYESASMMRYDGRDIRIAPWSKQKSFAVGYHYYLKPEQCVTGLNILEKNKFVKQVRDKHYNYPDCSTLTIS